MLERWHGVFCASSFLLMGAGCATGRHHVARAMGEAPERARASCAAGDGFACEAIGQRTLFAGVEGVVDLETSVDAFDRGCRAGSEASCREAEQLRWHAGTSLDLMPLCLDERDVSVCLTLGRANLFGLRTTPSPSLGLELLATACFTDTERVRVRAEACSLMAFALLIGPGELEPSPELATSLLSGWCAADNPHACSYLGFAHEVGLGVPRSADRAAELYEASRDLEFSRYRRLATAADAAHSPGAALRGWRALCLDEDPAGPPIARVACFHAAEVALEYQLPKATAYALLACRRGSTPGCQLLGTLYDARDAALADLDPR